MPFAPSWCKARHLVQSHNREAYAGIEARNRRVEAEDSSQYLSGFTRAQARVKPFTEEPHLTFLECKAITWALASDNKRITRYKQYGREIESVSNI